MKGKNKEIIIAHPPDKLWMLPWWVLSWWPSYIRNNPHGWGTVSQAIALWQRGSSAGSVINSIFYGFIDCSLAWSCYLMGRKRAWFKYLFSPSNNDSESCFSIRDLTGCLYKANCLLHSLTPTARKWTLHASWFPRRGGNLNGPGGSTSPGWKRSGTALPFFSFEEVVNPAGLAGKGYNRFDTL